MKGDFLKCGVLGWGMKFSGQVCMLWVVKIGSLPAIPLYGCFHIRNGSVYRTCFKENTGFAVGLARKYLHDGDFYGGVSFRHVFKAL